MDSYICENGESQEDPIASQSCKVDRTVPQRIPLTPALSLEGEGGSERIQSLRFVVQHLAKLLFGHARGAEQDQDDFRLEGFGLGERRAGCFADTRVDYCHIGNAHHRDVLALDKIGGDPGREQPAKLCQRFLHRLAVGHTVVKGNCYDTDPLLALPGNGRQAVRGIADANGHGVQFKGIGGRVFLREEHLRSQREIGHDGINRIALHHAARERGQFRPIAARLGRRDNDGERRSR